METGVLQVKPTPTINGDTPTLLVVKRRTYTIATLISLCTLVVYLINGWFFYPSGDTIPASLTPFSILLHGDVYLGRYFDVSALEKSLPYYLVPSNGDFVSYVYWIGPSLTALPIYVLYLLFGGAATFAGGAVAGKLSAAIICAVSVFLLYILLRKLSTRPWISILFTFLYGLGSETFSMSSQSLWRHGPGELWMIVFLLSVLQIVSKPQTSKIAPHIAGLAMGMLFICRAQDFVLVLPFIFLALQRKYRGRVLSSIPVLVIILVVWEVFRLHFYHSTHVPGVISKPSNLHNGLLGNVLIVIRGLVQSVMSKTSTLRGAFIQGLLGNTLSSSRGLFVFMPWTLFSFLWIRYFRRTSSFRSIYIFLTIGAIFYITIYSMLVYWDAGTSFGPRYMTDAIPAFVVLAAAYFESALSGGAKQAIIRWVNVGLLGLFSLWSIALQFLGAEVPMGVLWNRAVQPDYFHGSMWFVRDGEISYYLHTLRAVSRPAIVVTNPSVVYAGFTLFSGDTKVEAPLLHPGQTYSGTMLVTNNGKQPWSPYPSNTGNGIVELTSHVTTSTGKNIDPSGVSESFPLHTVYPGQRAELYFTLRTPITPGKYIYVFTLTQTGYGSFSHKPNQNTLQVPIIVTDK